MRFINPKTDFAFKKIFGSPQSKPVLISFLNGVLYDGTHTVQVLYILNPYQVQNSIYACYPANTVSVVGVDAITLKLVVGQRDIVSPLLRYDAGYDPELFPS